MIKTTINFLRAHLIHRYAPTLLVTMLCILLYSSDYAFSIEDQSLISIGLYSFCHANIFHLLINMYALWQFRPRWYTLSVSYIIAMLVVPQASMMTIPTCGLSVMILGCYARNYVSWNKNVTRIIIANLVLLVSNAMFSTTFFNVLAHAVSFFVAYIYWTIHYRLIIPIIKKINVI